MLRRFYPECSISDDISTEADRVRFLQSIAQITLTKARMKLNLKKLYAADGSAVRELLKLAALLYKATQTANSIDEVCNRLLYEMPGTWLFLHTGGHGLCCSG